MALYIPEWALRYYEADLPLYKASRIDLLFEEDILRETTFLALNPGEGYGRLQVLDPEDRPHPRDIVIYEALPNELPRVAGIISAVPQTPLSHVNLRAMKDGIPNAFIRDALDESSISSLIGNYVRYEVTDSGWQLRAATLTVVNEHYESSRPTQTQTPERDLSVTTITPLSQIGFNDWKAFGVKAANVAVLRTLGFPSGTVPDGFAIPFYFYDEFMKTHGFYTRIETMLADANFQTKFAVQDVLLDVLRDAIIDADSPQWIIDALTAMHETFPAGQSLRYRSSTNNEDLPGFNGAGLYDSNTQKPDETEEDGIDKSLKQVFASLWTFRAFIEREFHRIDPPGGGDGGAGASQLHRRVGQRRGCQLRPPLRPSGELLRQHAARRGPGHQSRSALGTGGNPAARVRWLLRSWHLQPGAAGATADERRPTGSVAPAS